MVEDDRGTSEVVRNTDIKEEDTVRKLENMEALIILFTVAMLPSFVVPQQLNLDNKNCA